jgi:histone deacetylase complex regulatory component SIN3
MINVHKFYIIGGTSHLTAFLTTNCYTVKTREKKIVESKQILLDIEASSSRQLKILYYVLILQVPFLFI